MPTYKPEPIEIIIPNKKPTKLEGKDNNSKEIRWWNLAIDAIKTANKGNMNIKFVIKP